MFALALEPHLVDRGLTVRTVALVEGSDPDLGPAVIGDRRLGPATLRRLRTEIGRASVAVAHGSVTLPATALAGVGTGVPYVYRNIGDPRFWAGSGPRRWRTSLLLRRAAGVVALTTAAARHLVDLHHLDPDRVAPIPTAVDPDEFPRRRPDDRAKARAALGLDPDVRLAACIGALSPEKGIPDAVRALADLPPRWHLAVAGTGPTRPEVEEEIERLDGGTAGRSRVRLLGQLDDPAQLLAAADVLVLPSHTEGLPGVVIEAAMVGVPAVATDVGFLADVVEPGVTGALVPPGRPDRLAAAVLEAEPDLEAMGERAHLRATADHALPAVADRWAAVLAPLVGR